MLEYKVYNNIIYVKVAPTTFVKVPDCYKHWGDEKLAECERCVVTLQCKEAYDELQLSSSLYNTPNF